MKLPPDESGDGGGKIMGGERCCCCPSCEPKVLYSWTQNPDSYNDEYCHHIPAIYFGDGIGTYCAVWRLYETGFPLLYGQGDINKDGKLVGLKNVYSINENGDFCTSYNYPGYMELQQGCIDEETGDITWP